MSAIPPVTPQDPEAASADLTAENIQALKTLFPQAFGDGRIDFEVLRQLLGDAVDDGDEKYGLNWSGKRRARRLALTPSLGTLRPAPEDSVEWDTTRNLMIEGDNLEVLKLLQKSYAGQVKLIYIDPPYNTGNDFVYPDDYADSLGNYLRRTGQKDEEGVRKTTNTESSGRYHTDWLNMMLPRLMLAKDLLRSDGAIFISIDDTEVSNLAHLCDAVFGEESFVGSIAWKKKASPDARSTIGSVHDTILCFVKNPDLAKVAVSRMPLSEARKAAYTNPDNDDRGSWASVDMTGMTGRATAEQYFDVVLPSGRTIKPPPGRSWGVAKATFDALQADNRIWFGKTGDSVPRIKNFLSESEGQAIPSVWDGVEVSNNEAAKKEVSNLFDGEVVFDTPKPCELVGRMLDVATSGTRDDIVLDFFAGSGTTGHAVMAQNAADGGKRRYILVQLPEPLNPENRDQKTAADFCDALGKPRNIAELTKERLRRAAAKVKADNSDATFDGGFRVYKLATSNLKAWQPGDDLEADLLSAADNLVEGRTEDDLLVELLLKQGIDLTEPVQTREIAGRTIHAFGGGVLVVCLGDVDADTAEDLADGMADWIAELAPVTAATVFFKDAGFQDDQAKTNVAAILEQRLGDDLLKVRSV